MISQSRFDAYRKSGEKLSEYARDTVKRQLIAWAKIHPNASIEDTRVAAIDILRQNMAVFTNASGILSCSFYDEILKETLPYLKPAQQFKQDYAYTVEKTARYQARHLIDGDVHTFAHCCAEMVADATHTHAQKTIMQNAGRDKTYGVRFARIPTGSETCTFCIMLASRGAVYHTQATAGEFNHWHRHCRCVVVPGNEREQRGILVEGCDPKEYYELWKKFNEVDTELKKYNKNDRRLIKALLGKNINEVSSRDVEIKKLCIRFEQCRSQVHKLQNKKIDEHYKSIEQFLLMHDANWLLYGEKIEPDYSEHAKENYIKNVDQTIAKNAVKKGTEWRDVYVHEQLAKRGIKAKPQDVNHLDLLVNGKYWEIKSVVDDNKVKSVDFRYIERAISKAKKQFKKRNLYRTRIIINLANKDALINNDIINYTIRKMKEHGVHEIILLDKESNLTYLNTNSSI